MGKLGARLRSLFGQETSADQGSSLPAQEQAGPLATDGGFLSDDIYGKLPQLGWEKLTKLFLHT